jgi:hypothetical protein
MMGARTLVLPALGVFVLVLLGFMEMAGLLLVIGYPLVAGGCVAFAAVLFVLSVLLRNQVQSRASLAGTILVCAVLSIFGLAVGRLPTSPRKRFYVISREIRSGDSVDAVKMLFKNYESWAPEEPANQCCYIDFRYTEPSTMDVVVVQYDPKTLRVLDSRYWID